MADPIHPFLVNQPVLRKDQADTTPFTLGVASAALPTDALRKGDTLGGFMRPYRKFRSVGTADKGASIASGMTAAITDPLNGGGVYEIGAIRLKTISYPSLLPASSVITIKSNGTTIYSYTIAAGSVPVVGNFVSILGVNGTLPADIVLPATLTVSSSNGTFDVTIDGVIVPPA